jgi:hypothetical protein
MSSRKFQALLFVVGIAGFIVFPSCKKNNSSKSNPSTASMTFMDSVIKLTSVSATLSGSGAVISASDALKSFGLILQLRRPFVLNSTLDMDSVGDIVQVTVTGRPDQWGGGFGWAPGDGKVTITSWDSVGHRLSGSFSGVLSGGQGYSEPLSVGTFDVGYTVE